MSVTISPPPLIELNRTSWDTPYEEDITSGPYVINYESSDTSTDTLKIEFSHTGPLRFCLSDFETPIDAPVYIRNSGRFRFTVRVDRDILNGQSNNITFRGLVKTTEESQTIPEPWYELVFDPPRGIFDTEFGNTIEVRAYFQEADFTAAGDTIVRRKMWPEGDFLVGPAEDRSGQLVSLSSQVRENNPPRLKLVFEVAPDDEHGNVARLLQENSAKFIVKPTNNWRYKDRTGQPLEVTLELSKKSSTTTTTTGGGGALDPTGDPEPGDPRNLPQGEATSEGWL